MDRYLRAHDTDDGKILWQTRLASQALGFTVTYAVNGRQYFAIAAGGGSNAAALALAGLPLLIPDQSSNVVVVTGPDLKAQAGTAKLPDPTTWAGRNNITGGVANLGIVAIGAQSRIIRNVGEGARDASTRASSEPAVPVAGRNSAAPRRLRRRHLAAPQPLTSNPRWQPPPPCLEPMRPGISSSHSMETRPAAMPRAYCRRSFDAASR
jgi:hypothetical protein